MADTQQRRDWAAIGIKVGLGLFGVLMVLALLRGMASQGEYESTQRAEDCESDYGYLLQVESYGHRAQNSHLWDDFRAECGVQVEALSNYVAARTTVRAAGNDCSGLEDQIDVELLDMLQSYGECDGVPLADGYEAVASPTAEAVGETSETQSVGSSPQQAWPGGAAIGWSEAERHVGSVQRVCGPLMSVRATDDGTFVNVGRDYPSADRFTFIFWDIYLQPIESGATICGSGHIYLYDGAVAQMEMRDPGALEIWR